MILTVDLIMFDHAPHHHQPRRFTNIYEPPKTRFLYPQIISDCCGNCKSWKHEHIYKWITIAGDDRRRWLPPLLFLISRGHPPWTAAWCTSWSRRATVSAVPPRRWLWWIWWTAGRRGGCGRRAWLQGSSGSRGAGAGWCSHGCLAENRGSSQLAQSWRCCCLKVWCGYSTSIFC